MSNLKITVSGAVIISTNGVDSDIEITGDICNSGCQDLELIKRIGLDNICNISDNEDVLVNYSVEELLDYLINAGGFTDDELNNIILSLQQSMV